MSEVDVLVALLRVDGPLTLADAHGRLVGALGTEARAREATSSALYRGKVVLSADRWLSVNDDSEGEER